jgi:hypothetical protein
MNAVFLSPHFPPNFRNFCIRLREQGANVLGLADAPYESLSPELRNSLSDYYRVWDMHNYDELVRALGFFTHRHGKLDRIDSHNEYWLETEAKLRTDFNIAGIKLDEINKIKRKSEMKRVFLQAGLKPARGRICRTEAEIRDFINEVGFPVVAKPDIGVGAATTYKIENETGLRDYLDDKPTVDYIFEEFVSGPIVTYDGLVDANGDLIYSTSLRYSKGVMDAVNEDTDLYYYISREIEPSLEAAGLSTLRAFDVRERFFHFEYFLKENFEVIPLEVNIRPPGGLTLDMVNYAYEFDCYRAWAQMVVNGSTEAVTDRLYFVIYVGRKDHINYALSHNQVIDRFGPWIVHHERISGVFARAIGHHGYIMRFEELEPLVEAANAIQKRAEG